MFNGMKYAEELRFIYVHLCLTIAVENFVCSCQCMKKHVSSKYICTCEDLYIHINIFVYLLNFKRNI